jgi:hypothetical protein
MAKTTAGSFADVGGLALILIFVVDISIGQKKFALLSISSSLIVQACGTPPGVLVCTNFTSSSYGKNATKQKSGYCGPNNVVHENTPGQFAQGIQTHMVIFNKSDNNSQKEKFIE